jgi:hypothetical protein
MSTGEPKPLALPQARSTYSGVRLRCHKCGVLRLTMEELQKLALARPDSRRCPDCGSTAEFV